MPGAGLHLAMAGETIGQMSAQARAIARCGQEQQPLLDEGFHGAGQAFAPGHVTAECTVLVELCVALHQRIQRQLHPVEANAGHLVRVNSALGIAGHGLDAG
ncbi:hypothetical protein D3C73_1024970 [compost metagenome]